MALPPITVQLSKFEQIEILRAEIQTRDEELKQAERLIRETLSEVERQKYLQTLHPLFKELQPPRDAAGLAQLLAKREALGTALQSMQATLTALERETAGQARPIHAAAAAAGAKRRFDSFDDFRANRGEK